MASQAKEPMKRAFAPKVRTGCFTCKKRHKKCDETRPVCHRCRERGYLCDGYPRTDEAKKAPLAQNRSLRFRALDLPRYLVPGNGLEQFFLSHFFSTTLIDLVELPESSVFWRDSVVTFHQQKSFIQPALVALGATHWLFITRTNDSPRLENYVVRQYNEAIAGLLSAISAEACADIGSLLTCCALFVFLECMRGNQASAFRHIEAGSRLIVDRLPLLDGGAAPELKWLVRMFHCLGTQSMIFAENRFLPDLTPYLIDKMDDNTGNPYTSIHEINGALDRLDRLLNHASWDVPINHKEGEDRLEIPEDCDCEACEAWSILRANVERFSGCLAPFLESFPDPLTDDQLQVSLRLKVIEKVWQWVAARDAHSNSINGWTFEPAKAGEVLNLMEQALAPSDSRPKFFLHAYMIPSLISVFEHCPDVGLRRRVIKLLRKYHGTEIVFNSRQVADHLETRFSHRLKSGGQNRREDLDIGPGVDGRNLLEFVPRIVSRNTPV